MSLYPSALMGEPPLTENDALIQRGLLIIAPSQLNPNKSAPFGPPRPADYHFETNAPSLIAGEAIAIFFILLFTGARLYRRLRVRNKFGLDDWMIIPAALGAITYLGMDIASQTAGCLGKHVYDCTYTEIYWYMRIGNVQQPLFYFAVFCVKLSLAFANRRITGLTSTRWMITHWVFIGLFVILLPLTVCLQAFQCVPVPVRYSLIYIAGLNDPSELVCLDSWSVSVSTRIIHIVTDVALLCVPITIMIRARMPVRKKLRIIAIFALGGMSTVASILRNLEILQYSEDITWTYYSVYVWNTIDICFGVVVASLPALNSLLDVWIEQIRVLTSHFTSKPTYGTDNSGSGSGNSGSGSWRKTPNRRTPDDTVDSDTTNLTTLPSREGKSSGSFAETEASVKNEKPKKGQSYEDFLLNDRSLNVIPTDIESGSPSK